MASLRKDILFGNDDDLLFKDGDFVIGESDQQHVIDSINAAPGWWKEFPIDGVNVRMFLKSAGGAQQLARKIKIELNKDGYTVNNPVVEFGTDGKLKIYPNASI